MSRIVSQLAIYRNNFVSLLFIVKLIKLCEDEVFQNCREKIFIIAFFLFVNDFCLAIKRNYHLYIFISIFFINV